MPDLSFLSSLMIFYDFIHNCKMALMPNRFLLTLYNLLIAIMISKIVRSASSAFFRNRLTFATTLRAGSLAPTDVLVVFSSLSCQDTSDLMRLKQFKC
jgi:hypothetical protein